MSVHCKGWVADRSWDNPACGWFKAHQAHEWDGQPMRHAFPIPGESNVEHAQHCALCQYHARRGPVTLRDEA